MLYDDNKNHVDIYKESNSFENDDDVDYRTQTLDI